MADQIVFLLHGMGTHVDAWHTPWVQALEGAYNQYPALQARAFRDRFEFVPIGYDRIFREILNAWANNTAAIAAEGFTSGLGSDLTSWLSDVGELKDNVGWTHAADVLLYGLFSLVRNRVCVEVADIIKTKLGEVGPGVVWSAIGHSLGTAVLHDTLARMFSGDSAFLDHYRARAVVMVANVSRALEQKWRAPANVETDAYQSVVRPGVACNFFLNLENELDPFVWPRRFRPVAWPDRVTLAANPPRYIHSGEADNLGRHYPLDHLHGKDVHGFEHYMVSPKAHIPMFRMLLGDDAFITPEQERRARDRFPRFGSLGDEAAIKLKQALENIQASESATWQVFGELWTVYRNS